MSSETTVGSERPTARAAARIWPTIALLAMSLLLAGCAGGITGIALDSQTRTVCDASGAVCGVLDSDRVTFVVAGQGKCDKIGIKYGDGVQEISNGNFYLFNPGQIYFTHHYTDQHPPGPRAWPGPRTVHAYSVTNCAGEAKMRVNLLLETKDLAGNPAFHSSLLVGMRQPTPTACLPVPDAKPMRAGSTVSITELPGSRMINFGCAFDGCTNNTAGNSGATHAGFPFPALRRHSLVLRIVSAGGNVQAEQGGPATRFVVREDGPLEFCVNDTVLSDNTGSWGMAVTVDETTIP